MAGQATSLQILLFDRWQTYLDAASNQVSDILLTASLQPVENQVAILFHLDIDGETRNEDKKQNKCRSEALPKWCLSDIKPLFPEKCN